jgi:hypothetical protein
MARCTASGSIRRPSSWRCRSRGRGRTAVARRSPPRRCRHGVPVVLDEEADRQLPGRGEVEGLEGRADVDGAVAEVGDRRLRLCPPACAPRRIPAASGTPPPTMALVPIAPASCHCRCMSRRGRGSSRGPGRRSRRASAARTSHLAETRGGSMPLGATWCSDLGEELVVPAVRAVDRVLAGEPEHRADGAALLADAGVRRAVHQPSPASSRTSSSKVRTSTSWLASWSAARAPRRPSRPRWRRVRPTARPDPSGWRCGMAGSSGTGQEAPAWH